MGSPSASPHGSLLSPLDAGPERAVPCSPVGERGQGRGSGSRRTQPRLPLTPSHRGSRAEPSSENFHPKDARARCGLYVPVTARAGVTGKMPTGEGGSGFGITLVLLCWTHSDPSPDLISRRHRGPSELGVTHCDVPMLERALSYPQRHKGKGGAQPQPAGPNSRQHRIDPDQRQCRHLRRGPV